MNKKFEKLIDKKFIDSFLIARSIEDTKELQQDLEMYMAAKAFRME